MTLAKTFAALVERITPGPFVVHGRPGRTQPIEIGRDEISPFHTVAKIYQPTGRSGVAEANAEFIAFCFNNAHQIAEALGERERIVRLLDNAAAIFSNCVVEDGVCCCGDNMSNHPQPMNCGHSPVDHGAYVTAQWMDEYHDHLHAIEAGTHNQGDL